MSCTNNRFGRWVAAWAAGAALWTFAAAGAGVAWAQDAGVRVNGTDVSAGSGDGWSRNGEEVILQRNGMTYVVDGTASGGSVRIVLMANCTMVASNLALSGGTPVSVYNGYSPVLELAGTNSFSGGGDCAGLGVPEGRSITIRGDGALTATGGSWGAGIGAGAYTNTGSVTIEGGMVTARAGTSSAGIGGGYKGHGGTVAISGGTVSATGNSYGAGIGGGYQGKAGDVTISGGTVSATGGSGWGEGGAGIGSGTTAARGGSVVISGGTVTATGGGNSAGIGGGYRTVGFDVSIRGGLVVAKGTGDGAGIGGGGNTSSYGETARISVSGGTVRPAAGGYGWDIGPGSSDSCEYRVTLSGGSVGTVAAEIKEAPTNSEGAAVWRVAVSGFAADEPVTGIAGLPAGYGTEGIVADGDGKVYLWLPDGSYRFKAVSDGEVRYVAAVVAGASVETAVQDGTGLLVNGEDVALGTGPGWSYDGAHQVVLSGNGPFALTGTSSGLCVRVAASCTVAASNLSLDVRGVDGAAALEIGSGVSATLALAGTNVLRSGSWAAGVQVGDGRSLRIVDAEGQEPNAGRLEARGGNNAAGIGGGNGQGAGSIALAGGTVAAYGGEFAAGIGSGRNGQGGTVSVEDGAVVEKADGGWWGAGIGGGECSTGPEVVVSGGRILSAGGYYGACIGGGGKGTNAVVRISGGEVAAGLGTGLSCAGIGGGRENVGVVVEISGGTVVAAGLQDAAGIGVAGDSRDCRVSITGGRVWATGGNGGGAGIGGASASTGLEISISGGTVVPAVRGADPGNLVGFGRSQSYGATCGVAFTGGSVAAGEADVVPAATNRAGQTVWPVTVPLPQGTDTNAPVAFRALPAGYGTNDIYPDAQGQVYLWLANGTHLFAAVGTVYRAEVADAGTVAAPWVSGLEVNGVDIVALSGEGWTYDVGSRLELSGPGPFTVSGSISNVGLVAVADCAVTLSNALFDASAANGVSAFALEGGRSVALTLAGTNELRGGANAAGIRVPAADSLAIDGDGALAAAGGDYGAGIGGARAETSGSVTVSNGTVSATGGWSAAGIGGGGTPAERGGSGGSCTIAGGKVTAQGGASGGAGIGGGSYEGAGGTIVISGGEVAATGGRYGAGIGGGHQGAAVSCTILGGTVTAQGGDDGGAGIGGGSYGDGGTIVISNGTVTATAGFGAAGLGGGMNRSGGSCTIAGGTVTAQGGGDAAGIGGGNIGAGGTIAISGGLVHATGGNYGAGLGGGSNGADATVTVTGGTVVPKGGYGAPFDVGPGYGSHSQGGPVSFTGGSVAVASVAVTNAPTGVGGARVWRVEVGGLPPGGEVTGLTSLTSPSSLSSYGTDDIWADAAGKIYLWLPDGLYDFEVAVDGGDAVGYVAWVDGADTAANVFVPSGLTVNGRDVAHLVGDGWWCDGGNSVFLTNSGPFTVGGTSQVYGVTALADCMVTASNLCLDTRDRTAFEVGGNGVSVELRGAGAGTNTFISPIGYAGIAVCGSNNAALYVKDGGAAISATSRGGAAGIGGNGGEAAGTICIEGGKVVATGADGGAGIGGGSGGGAGSITVSGGTVEFVSWTDAYESSDAGAGIGGGRGGSGGTVTISGGTVTGTAGKGAAGIGGGYGGSDISVRIENGTVTVPKSAKDYATGIGMGQNGRDVTVEILGGTVSAKGSWHGAGIGGSAGCQGGQVAIYGGRVTAEGGGRGPGIGPAFDGTMGTIAIVGGTVEATAGTSPADIGAGSDGDGGVGGQASVVAFHGGNILAGPTNVIPAPKNMGLTPVWAVDVQLETWDPDELVAFHYLPDGYGTNDLYPSGSGLLRLWLPNGEYAFLANDTPYHATVSDAATTAEVWQTGFTVNGRDIAHFFGPGWNMDWATRRVSLTNAMDYAVAGTSTQFWVLADADCDVTVTDVTINLTNAPFGPSAFKLGQNRRVTLAVEGTNLFAGAEYGAGVAVTTGTSVAISGGGTLTARGGKYGAGIGGGNTEDGGTIAISGDGTVVKANGGASAAGIGGGREGNGGTIEISDGRVEALGGPYGAGIGGGAAGGNGGTIRITDATVTATGGTCGAGIGGGDRGASGNIVIAGTAVTAQGGEWAAGIGGGSGGGAGGSVGIAGGTVVSTGGDFGAGIGSGSSGTSGTVLISGGEVTATGGKFAAGIGGGERGTNGTVTITGGTVTAKGDAGGGAGIGGGEDGDGGTILISGDADVTATGGLDAAGIGGGAHGAATVTISGGTVTATGGGQGAGIGGGSGGTNGTVTVSGGTVTATAGRYGAGIGSGQEGRNWTIAIEGGAVTATGGYRAAGIGGALYASQHTIRISSGTVTATGGNYAPGIGCGDQGGTNDCIVIEGGIIRATDGGSAADIGNSDDGRCRDIQVSGGTIYRTGDSPVRIGGAPYRRGSPVTFTGGSIHAALDTVTNAPVNSTPELVYPAELDIGLATNKVSSMNIKVVMTNSSSYTTLSYGVRDMYTDGNGMLVVWLPSTGGMVYEITVRMEDGSVRYFCISIDAGGEVHIVDHLVVNGAFVLAGVDQRGSGWTYTNSTKQLTLTGNATVQGTSTNGGHRILVPAGGASSVALQGLTLRAAGTKNYSPIAISNTCTLSLDSGIRTNMLAALGQYAAGLEVASNATVTITGDSPLVAVGGKYGAGIGSRGGNAPCGKIEIRSGNVTGIGGEKAAGIGGGLSGNLQVGSIVVKGGIVAGYGGANAAGIGAGYKPNGTFRVPDGAFRVEAGSVAAYGDQTPAADALSTGTQSWSDFVDSLGNTQTPTDDGAFKPTVITGGSVVPSRLRRASPRPVNAEGECLYRVLMGGFGPFEEVDVSCEDLPADYSTDGIVADANGLVCIWMAATNHAHVVVANGQYFTSHYPSTNTASLYPHDSDLVDGASDVPPGDLPPSGPDRTNTLHRVTVPMLDPGADVALEIQAYTETLYPKADSEGRYFFYVADGDYIFKANGFDYAVVVDAGPATAFRVDPSNPTGVTVDGVDVCAGIGAGWTYDMVASNLVLSAGAPVVSGSNTEGRVNVTVAADMTLTVSGLTLNAARLRAAIAVSPGVAATLLLEGQNTLFGGREQPGVRVPAGASLEIAGDGALDATGGHYGAGIGGDATETSGTVVISGGTVNATGGMYSAGIGGGGAEGAANGTVVVAGGTVTAHGGSTAAGIGGSNGGGTISVTGGTVVADTIGSAAGIGGGLGGTVDSITVSGGTVTATGGNSGAGIGGGPGGTVGAIAISGGIVTATGGSDGAGIGGGKVNLYGQGGTVDTISISGGTVVAQGGSNAQDIGHERDGECGSTVFTGGSIHAMGNSVVPIPSNGTARVWCVTVPDLAPGAAVTGLAGLPDYNTDGIVADDAGQIYLWLPDGTHFFEIDGVPYGAYVDGADATAERIVPYGVLVDGRDVSELSGEGWIYDWGRRQLLLSGDSHVIAGSNTEGRVWVVLSNDMTLTASDLVLAFTDLHAAHHPPIAIPPGISASLALEGSNSLCAVGSDAAVNVPAGATLFISGEGSLRAVADNGGAAIGGSDGEDAGRIGIASGTVTAEALSNGAGIGGGYLADGGLVAIGGGTVTASSRFGAGIGGGSGQWAMGVPGGAGGTVEISGGFVSVSAGDPGGTGVGDGAGIGGGSFGAAAAVTVTGGTIVYTGFGPAIAPPFAIGSGYFPDYAPLGPGTNVIRGGSVVVTNVAKVQGGATDAAGAAVWPVTFAGLAPGAPVAFADFERDGAPAAYGTSGIVADANGLVVLWLPNGTYTGTIDGTAFYVIVEDAPATARIDLPTGVYVDGTDVQAASGDGWSYDFATGWLVVSNDGHVVSGSNTAGRVAVSVTNSITLSVSNLTLAIGADSKQSALVVQPNCTATLLLQGDSSLRGGEYRPAVEVPLYATLTVAGTGTLAATGGYHAAAIGGRSMNTCGRITLAGGTILPVAGETAPAIGRGAQSYSGGFVHFTGGSIVVDRDAVVPAPSNTVGQAVWPVTVEGLVPGAPVAIAVSPGSYGTDGIVADPDGKIVLWLPNGYYDLDVGGTAYVASVHDAGDTAEPAGAPVGVFADGIDLMYRHGTNWTFTATNGELAVEGACTVSGSNTARRIHLHLANDSRVTYSNLWITSGTTVVLDSGARATLRGIGFNSLAGTADYVIWGPGAQLTIESGTFWFHGAYMGGHPVILGGSVYGSVFGNDHATDGTRDVWRVTVGGFSAYAPVALEGLPADYDVSEIHADASGNIYLWLPDGLYDFTADGTEYLVRVDGAYATAEPYTPRGVTVDGTDVGRLVGPGWSYHPETKHLAVGADCVISGTNDAGAVSVRVAADCAVTFSNLCLRLTGTTGSYSPVILGDGVSATLLLSGSNTLWAGSGSAAVGVPTGTALTVAGDGILDASGGYVGAGIGGWNTTGCGTVSIEGGILLVGRGAGAACIGGGERGAGGDVTISGGTVLLRESTSSPVPYSIGRGRNSGGTNGTLTITGGSLGELPRNTASHALPLNLLGSAPTNAAGAPVYSVAITNLAPNAPVAFTNLPAYYATDTIVADASGNVFLWLPDGIHDFTADGTEYIVRVAGASVTAEPYTPLGVTVDGTDIARLTGPGWDYISDNGELALSGARTVAGSNTARNIHLRLADGAAVTCSNLAITAATPVLLDKDARVTLRGIGFNDMSATGTYAIDGSGDAQATIESGTFSFGDRYMFPLPVIRGGSVYGIGVGTTGRATDGTNDLWRVTVEGLTPGAPVTLEGLPDTYDVSEIHADASGKIYLWLPDNTYAFTANGIDYLVDVYGRYTTAEPNLPVGVTVDGTDVHLLAGPGWTYNPYGRQLAITNDCVISGSNGVGAVSVRIAADCAVTLSNVCLLPSGSSSTYFPVLLCDGVSATLVLAGSNTLRSSQASAAVGVPTNTALTVAGDGNLDAFSGYGGAVIGGWKRTGCGTIAIEGGILVLCSDTEAACIGGGEYSDGGDVTISGGTVLLREYVYRPSPYAIGRGESSTGSNGTLTITGGSLGELPTNAPSHALALDRFGSAPTNAAGAPVYSVAITNLAPNAPVAFANLPAGYGADAIIADAFGNVYLWLPDGDYAFTAGGTPYAATVSGTNTTATVVSTAIGVTVDGTDISSLSGPGWTYDADAKQLTLSADCTLSGSNGVGAVSVLVSADCTVTLSNLCLRCSDGYTTYAPVLLDTNVAATLVLAGDNTLRAVQPRAAIGVPPGTSLTVTGDGRLDAAGGYMGAGIGGWLTTGCGTVSIEGGILVLGRGTEAACIGGGSYGDGGDVAISGGTILLREYTSAPIPNSIGRGHSSTGGDGTLTITGGSLGEIGSSGTRALDLSLLGSAPTNAAGEALYTVAITNLAPNAPVAFSGLPAWYGTDSIVADAHGNIYLWLPSGDWSGVTPSTSSRRGDTPDTHVFAANGYEYTVAFEDDAATVTSVLALPLESLDIVSSVLSPDATTLTLTVTATPATWTHGFLGTLSVRQTGNLTLPETPADVQPALAPDGTVTYTLPLDFTGTTSTLFFRIQSGQGNPSKRTDNVTSP